MQKIKLHEPEWGGAEVEKFTASLNKLNWKFTRHSFDRIFERYPKNAETVLKQIKNARLKVEDAFEYCTNEFGNIEKACYEIPMDGLEAVHVSVSWTKEIITAWRVFIVSDEYGNKKVYLSN